MLRESPGDPQPGTKTATPASPRWPHRPPVGLPSNTLYPFPAATSETDAIGTEPRECVGVEEIWATKAPRTMARQETTKASFQPCDFDTSRM